MRQTSEIKADGKIAWSRHPDAGVKFRGIGDVDPNGPTRRAKRRGLTSPVPRGEREDKPLKPIAQGMSDGSTYL